MSNRPNILFLQADQLLAEAIGAYGSRVAHTPCMDSIAKSGTVFTNAYCNFPLCAPSRFSMATGQLASRIGVYDNAAEMPASVPTYAHYLRALGYQTCLSGKMHFVGPDQLHGFEERLMPDIYPSDFSWVPDWRGEGKRDTNDARGVTVSGPCIRTVQLDYDDETALQSVRKIHDLASSDDKRPFFLQVSLTHPHEPYLCRRKYWRLYEDVDVPMPRVPSLSPDEHDPHSRRLLEQTGMLGTEFSEEVIRRARRAYYGAVTYVDEVFGRVLEALEETGLAEDTAVIIGSDHGEMLGERGLWFKKTFFEPSIRVPLIVRAPGRQPTPDVDENVSLVDLLPTLLDLAGASEDAHSVETLDGESVLPLMQPEPSSRDRAVFAEYLSENALAPILMVKKGHYKLVYSAMDPDQLYDLQSDPDETVNLAGGTGSARSNEVCENLRREVENRWDESRLTEEILLSQRRRILIRKAMQEGVKTRWDADRSEDDRTRWYRGDQGYNEWAFSYI